MGTNYYAESSPCKECGHVMTRTHIGKCSGGWPFLFRCYEMHPTTFREWLMLLGHPRVIIKDEYGDKISLNDFADMVVSKKDLKPELMHSRDGYNDKYYYYDDQGYRFSYKEFC